MNNQEANTIEIDVLSLLRTIWRKKFLILLTAILTTGLAFAYSAFLVTPQYDSTTSLYVVNQSSDNGAGITNQDLQAGSFLVKDYKEIILSQDVLKNVTTTLGITDDIKEKITKVYRNNDDQIIIELENNKEKEIKDNYLYNIVFNIDKFEYEFMEQDEYFEKIPLKND
jgi:capsular polysaccharide biosynthesis protein